MAFEKKRTYDDDDDDHANVHVYSILLHADEQQLEK
jgi:hypothetical protein